MITRKIAPRMAMKSISPFKTISWLLRAFNLVGALPLRFREDENGKIKVRFPNRFVHVFVMKKLCLSDFLFEASGGAQTDVSPDASLGGFSDVGTCK